MPAAAGEMKVNMRYLNGISIDEAEVLETDVVIIGSGIAGLYAAWNLDHRLSCILLTKDKMETSSSSLAQGGIAAVTDREDKIEYHFKDTMSAGAGYCDEEAVRIIVTEGPGDIFRLLTLGMQFDVDKKGKLKTTREGGHGVRRILHAGGDATGREIVAKLKELVLERENVRFIENAFASDIVTTDNKVAGIFVYNDGWQFIKTGYIIIASGGAGQVFRYTTNPQVATGDGMAMAARAGAKLKNMEFVQFHPTGFYSANSRNFKSFLISEAVRGEGGILRNDAGERFMVGKHEMAELAPRDIVAREIFKQIETQASPFVKLDITFKGSEYLTERFPTIYKTCLENGVDITSEYIPVGPLQHYMMGGIETDMWGLTSVKGLYACGEAACTGVHGANRLASNSTLECMVFGRRCADYINGVFEDDVPDVTIDRHVLPAYDGNTWDDMIELKGIMIKYCGIVRSGKWLKVGIERLKSLKSRTEGKQPNDVRSMELYNMIEVSERILHGAYGRKTSAGAHFREDT